MKRLIGRPQEALLCAKAKRQQQMFYLRESEASAANVLSVRKRSDSNKAHSRNGNQLHVLVVIHNIVEIEIWVMESYPNFYFEEKRINVRFFLASYLKNKYSRDREKQ
ncbi:hypothetical protein [Lysinibacillus sp. JNUCC 51]|uniref:hypothetical protein n=1 Tax=Lysinibacillus sp. JNUCC-51 TaxID=2792479 RepID=UPI0019363949|nr:hypothetical protein JNUCC51_05825 [Lysinibacillus sp. JNUCC-51]